MKTIEQLLKGIRHDCVIPNTFNVAYGVDKIEQLVEDNFAFPFEEGDEVTFEFSSNATGKIIRTHFSNNDVSYDVQVTVDVFEGEPSIKDHFRFYNLPGRFMKKFTGHLPATVAVTLNDAMERVRQELADSQEGTFYYGWQSNIAMSFVDAFQKAQQELKGIDIKEIANHAAINFLNRLRQTGASNN